MIERGEEEQLDNLGFKLGLFIERKLKLPYSLFVLPQDIALVSASVYLAEYQDDIVITTPAREKHIHCAIERYNPQIFFKYFDKNGLLNSYPNLIGHGDYSKGELAKALRDAPQNLTPIQNSWLEKGLAEHFARYIRLYPDTIPNPEISINFSNAGSTELKFKSFLHSTGQISNMVEYAPGLRSLKRIPGELQNIGQSTLIESRFGTLVRVSLY